MAGEYTIAGSAALYERHKDLDKLRIPGPIKDDILIYVSNCYKFPRCLLLKINLKYQPVPVTVLFLYGTEVTL